jgi:hypothetical protein
MKNILVIFLTFSLIFISSVQSFPSSIISAKNLLSLQTRSLNNTQLGFFTENKGQWDPSILYRGDTSFGKLVLAKEAVYYQMIKTKESNYESQTIKLSFVNSLKPKVEGIKVLPHYNNYFLGNNPSKWASYCRNYSKIEYLDVWEGIDLAYFFTPEGIKYEFYVSPDANAQDLQIKVEGAKAGLLGTSLQMTTTIGNIFDTNLKVFDQVTGRLIPSIFTLNGNTISFSNIPLKRENTVVIDPLVYSTYLGGTDEDFPKDIVVDKNDSVYICGYTRSDDFPVTPDSFQNKIVKKFREDGFITKLSPSGDALVYSTFFGGSDYDVINGIKVDAGGNIYIAGGTNSQDFPISQDSYQMTNQGKSNCFVSKLNADGNKLIYSTYIGGTTYDYAQAIAIDSIGCAYITGISGSPDFPVTRDAIQTKNLGKTDILLSKLDPAGKTLLYSTLLGGSKDDKAYDVTIDNDGNTYITGETNSLEFPTTKDAYQKTINGTRQDRDAFITKVDTIKNKLIYSSYLGGSDHEEGIKIRIDSKENIYICGRTGSYNFPVTPGAFQISNSGDNASKDIFVTKFKSSGADLLYSTYIGGSNGDWVSGFDIDETGNAFICGYTFSDDFPITESTYQVIKKNDDAFITKLNATGTDLIYSTYLGGNGADRSTTSCIDPKGFVYIAGITDSEDYPTKGGLNNKKQTGGFDIFITKFDVTKTETPKETLEDDTPPELVIKSPEDFSEIAVNSVEIIVEANDKETGIQSVTMDGYLVVPRDRRTDRYVYKVPLKRFTNKIEVVATNRIGMKTTKVLTIIRRNPIILELWINQLEAVIDGKKTAMDVAPLLRYNRTFVPLRFISESLGATVDWDSQNQKITIHYGPITLTMWLTSSKVEKVTETDQDKKVETFILESPPFIHKGRTVVPLRFTTESFGAEASWDGKTQKITIILKKNLSLGGK